MTAKNLKKSTHNKTKLKNKNAVPVVVADGSNAATVTPGNSTELLQQQQYQQQNTKIIIQNSTLRSYYQSHRTCPAHVYAQAKYMMTESGVLSGCSDASTNSSAELLDMEVDDKIAPIFEEDLDDEDIDLEEEEEECEEEEDNDDDEECIEIDVERDDSDFCGASRKSTYSVKSSVSRYDKLLTFAAPKQPTVMPTSLSFNDNSNATNTKLQQLRQKQQLKEQQKVQRWSGKFKTTDKKQTISTKSEENNKTATAGGSQKNIVKRALLSLASGGNNTTGGGGTRPKSTSSLQFGNNKLHLLSSVGRHKSKQQQQPQSTNINQETTAVDGAAATTVTVTTTTTTTKSNLGNIITSLLRTTTL